MTFDLESSPATFSFCIQVFQSFFPQKYYCHAYSTPLTPGRGRERGTQGGACFMMSRRHHPEGSLKIGRRSRSSQRLIVASHVISNVNHSLLSISSLAVTVHGAPISGTKFQISFFSRSQYLHVQYVGV